MINTNELKYLKNNRNVVVEKTKDKKYLGNSILNQIYYKFWLWRATYPFILFNIGFRPNDLLCYISTFNNIYKSYFFLDALTIAKDYVLNREYDNLFNYLESGCIGIDEIIDPLSGFRILHYAVILDDSYIVEYLIKKKANLMVRDYFGSTALIKSASLGRIEIFNMLINAGVPLNHKDFYYKHNSYSKAKIFKQKEIMQIIDDLNYSNKTNIEKKDYWINKGTKEVYKTKSFLFRNIDKL